MQDSELLKQQCKDEFKNETARLTESVGGHEAARRLGVPVATLGNWQATASGCRHCCARSRRGRFSRAYAPASVRTGGRAQPVAQGAC